LPWRRSPAGLWRVSRSLSTATGVSAATSPMSRTWPGRWNLRCAGPAPARWF
jgi:hypothetical protein